MPLDIIKSLIFQLMTAQINLGRQRGMNRFIY